MQKNPILPSGEILQAIFEMPEVFVIKPNVPDINVQINADGYMSGIVPFKDVIYFIVMQVVNLFLYF